MASRDDILNALSAWVNQRPGLEFCNYGDVSNYRSEMRRITRQLHDARTLLAAVRWRQSIGVEELRAAFRAYSGRLTLEITESGAVKLDYCTGQYWPTEYRAAACAVLASALWDYFRANMPAERHDNAEEPWRSTVGDTGLSPGDYLRKGFKREFGQNLQERWFS